MNNIDLLIKTCELEKEYLTNPNPVTAKKLNKFKNQLFKNKQIYNMVLQANITKIQEI